MNKLIIPLLFIASMLLTACSDDDEPVVVDNIVGTWVKQYPEGLQTEGFIDWVFNTNGELNVKVSDVFAGDSSIKYDYALSDKDKSLTISGYIKNVEGETIHDKFAIYDVVKLTKKELRIKQSWVNTNYDSLEPEDRNAFLLGGYKEVTFKKSNAK